MDAQVKNLRQWIILLFLLFCALDIAALQYRMTIAWTASARPDPIVGQIVAIVHGSRGAWYDIYVTQHQVTVFYAILGAAAASLLATLGAVVGYGIQRARAFRPRRGLSRKGQDHS